MTEDARYHFINSQHIPKNLRRNLVSAQRAGAAFTSKSCISRAQEKRDVTRKLNQFAGKPRHIGTVGTEASLGPAHLRARGFLFPNKLERFLENHCFVLK